MPNEAPGTVHRVTEPVGTMPCEPYGATSNWRDYWRAPWWEDE